MRLRPGVKTGVGMGKVPGVAGVCAVVFVGVVSAQQAPAPPAPPPPARSCRAIGHVSSADLPLPGATVTVHAGDKVAAMSSTDVDGSYNIALAPGMYRLKIELMAFVPV